MYTYSAYTVCVVVVNSLVNYNITVQVRSTGKRKKVFAAEVEQQEREGEEMVGHLSPDELAGAERDAPEPLLDRQLRRLEHRPQKLDQNYLRSSV